MSTSARSAPRRRSRAAALQALYAADVGSDKNLSHAIDSLKGLEENFEFPLGAREFAHSLVEGIAANASAIDECLERAARNWRIDRMSVVDRNVLRLAAFEMKYLGTPAEIAIDEAVELARRYGDEHSPRFVNGVLGALVEKEAS